MICRGIERSFLPQEIDLCPVDKYVQTVGGLSKEVQRSTCFALFLTELFGVNTELVSQYIEGLESSISGVYNGRIVHGEVDSLVGNVIIEFKVSFPRMLEEAKQQLMKYVSMLWSAQPDEKHPYLLVATDGLQFFVYTPSLDSTHNVILNSVDHVSFSAMSYDEIWLWVTRYFCPDALVRLTSGILLADFGPSSHAFNVVMPALIAAWHEVKDISSFSVIYENWERHLSLIYGSSISGIDLFAKHTYLATIAKLLGYLVVSRDFVFMTEQVIFDVISGDFFRSVGLLNFIEQDYFAWTSRDEVVAYTTKVIYRIASVLRRYDLSTVTHDLVKPLYQQLVDPETRHDLGEYYTPDWLAELMIKEVLAEQPSRSVLDPACGSGTFLSATIRAKRASLTLPNEVMLKHILSSVAGADVHPLAVMIAKTNYLVAISDLLQHTSHLIPICLPIYLADMLRVPEQSESQSKEAYQLSIEGKSIKIPHLLFSSSSDFDIGIDLCMEFASQTFLNESRSLASFKSLLQARRYKAGENEEVTEALFHLASVFANALKNGRDGIWPFVLKNMYRPLLWKQRFDIVIGNPPWIAFRNLGHDYQRFIRKHLLKFYELSPIKAQQVSNIEMALLFYLRSADLYLNYKGIIAFVMPRTLVNADHYDKFRRKKFKLKEQYTLKWEELWDCESVDPLFSVPACVLIASKQKTHTAYKESLLGRLISGRFARRDCTLAEANRTLSIKPITFYLQTFGRERSAFVTTPPVKLAVSSPYKKKFFQGACLGPRSLWFVSVVQSMIGVNQLTPLVSSRATNKAGPVNAYRDLAITENIEARFLYVTLLGGAIMPFAHMDPKLVVLPIRPASDRLELISPAQARLDGYLHLARWLEIAENHWHESRMAKGKKVRPLLECLNDFNKLTRQNMFSKYIVVYPNFQRVAIASVISTSQVVQAAQEKFGIAVSGFVLDSALYGYETDNEAEAYYLCGCLNAPLIDEMLQPLRRSNQKSLPNVHKKLFDIVPIPVFDPKDMRHCNIAAVSQSAASKADLLLAEVTDHSSTGKLRKLVRAALYEELTEINVLLAQVISAETDANGPTLND